MSAREEIERKRHHVNDPREGRYLLCRKGLRKNSAKTTQQQNPMPRTQPLPKKQKKVGCNRSTRRVPKNTSPLLNLSGKINPSRNETPPPRKVEVSPLTECIKTACLPTYVAALGVPPNYCTQAKPRRDTHRASTRSERTDHPSHQPQPDTLYLPIGHR